MALLQPVQLGPYTLKNRIFMSALTRNRAVPTNVPNDLMITYYKQRAEAGLIVTEGTLISQQGTEWPTAPGIWNRDQTAAWKKITDVVHSEGGRIFSQLWHVGRVAHPDMPEQKESGKPVYAPSAIAAKGGKFRLLPGSPGYVTPTAIDDPTLFIAEFKQAAINAKEAGFDGVEVHGANGYLVSQFLDSGSNQRTDKWGGSVENRSRFGLDTLKALIEVYGADRVGIKLSPCGGYNDMGMPLEETKETFNYFITEAIKLNIAYITLVRHSPMFDPTGRGTEHDVISTYGPLFGRTEGTTKLFANGGFTPEEAEKTITDPSNPVEGIFFGSSFLSHPDLVKRVKHGKPLDNQPNFATFYTNTGDIAVGYTDYPAAKYD